MDRRLLLRAKHLLKSAKRAVGDAAPSLGGTATTDAVAPAIRQLK